MKVHSYQLLAISFGIASLLCQAELTGNLKPEAESLFIYEPFNLLLQANEAIETPKLPASGSFTVAGISADPDNKTYRLTIIPERTGTLTIPPISLQSESATNATAPLRLLISAPRHADEMDLSITFSATNLYIDQPVRMDVIWTSATPFTQCEELLFEIPILRNPNWEFHALEPDVPENLRIGLPVNGLRVIAANSHTENSNHLSFSFMLIPSAPGNYTAGPARLNCALLEKRQTANRYPSYFDNHFFNIPDKDERFARVYLDQKLPELQVSALPEEGRTSLYSGIVGPCSFKMNVQPAETLVGQPMLLTLELSDLTFGNHIAPLPEAVLDNLGPEFSITPEPMHNSGTSNSHTFTYVIRPLKSGLTALPALAIQTFDPQTKTYRILRTNPQSIAIDPDNGKTVYRPGTATLEKPKTPLAGIRGNRQNSRVTMTTTRILTFLGQAFWIFLIAPPLIWLALRNVFRHLDRCRVDPAYARAAHAARRFRKNAVRHEEKAWRQYLADRFNLNAEAVTADSITMELKKQNVPPDLIQAVREHFNHQDASSYAPQNTPPKSAPHIRELVHRIGKATTLLLMLSCLVSATASHAATAETVFNQAMELRDIKPDEARPLFTEAALKFETSHEFFNAGNSWFFAGENGRALANYLAAESRMPFDSKTRESIAFIRSQREDNFPPSDTPLSKTGNVWKQFGRWQPAIRGGLFILIYLTGWMAFLAARFMGKHIPLKLWIAGGVVALVPVASLIWTIFQPTEGVVIQTAEARLGPGYAYDPAYNAPLHDATEFKWIGEENNWIHARLPDDSEAWLRKSAVVKIR